MACRAGVGCALLFKRAQSCLNAGLPIVPWHAVRVAYSLQRVVLLNLLQPLQPTAVSWCSGSNHYDLLLK